DGRGTGGSPGGGRRRSRSWRRGSGYRSENRRAARYQHERRVSLGAVGREGRDRSAPVLERRRKGIGLRGRRRRATGGLDPSKRGLLRDGFLLDRLAAREALVRLVPVLHRVLAELPAEEDLLALAARREVDQALLEALDLDPEMLQLLDELLHLR